MPDLTKNLIISKLEDEILNVARIANEVSNSDLQAIAHYSASIIFRMAGNDTTNWKPLLIQLKGGWGKEERNVPF